MFPPTFEANLCTGTCGHIVLPLECKLTEDSSQKETRLSLAVHAMVRHIFSLLWVSRREWMSILFNILKKTVAIPAALQDYSIVMGNKDFT